MPDKSGLGVRMKENYENRSKQFLTRRLPTIIRLDGKAFHTYTKGLDRPFDEGLIEDMQLTTKFLCENIQGCKLGYTQSDEITLVLTDYDDLNTQAWFDYNVQKMVSISASMATAEFNRLRLKRLTTEEWYKSVSESKEKGLPKLAFFDSRVFQIPEKEEVVNCLIWRQRDAEKNSVAMLAQSLYSHKELYKKNGSNMQEMCFQKGHNWNDLRWSKKRGSLIIKNTYVDKYRKGERDSRGCLILEFFTDTNKYAVYDDASKEWKDLEKPVIRSKWEVVETPIFSQDKDLILKLI
jgi:tRNA(His) guanylyltransferase